MKNLGLQLYTVRDYLTDAEHIRDTFKKLRNLGYTEAQTFSSGDISYTEFAQIAKEEGIRIVGTHYNFNTMKEDIEKTIADHKAMETTNCGIGGFWGKTKEDVMQFIKEANDIADKIYEHGMKFTYHNHSHEFAKVDGDTTIMDLLVDGLNPEKTSFVLDTCWVQFGGGDVRAWIEKLKGRVDILHLKDFGRAFDEEQQLQVILDEIGCGNLYWDGIIETAEKCGIPYFCVEQDRDWIDNDPFKSLKISADYLKKYIK